MQGNPQFWVAWLWRGCGFGVGDDFDYGPAGFAQVARRGSRCVCAVVRRSAGDGIFPGFAFAGRERGSGEPHRGTFRTAQFWLVRDGTAGGRIVYRIYRDLGAGVRGGVYAVRRDWMAVGDGILGTRARDRGRASDYRLRV